MRGGCILARPTFQPRTAHAVTCVWGYCACRKQTNKVSKQNDQNKHTRKRVYFRAFVGCQYMRLSAASSNISAPAIIFVVVVVVVVVVVARPPHAANRKSETSNGRDKIETPICAVLGGVAYM